MNVGSSAGSADGVRGCPRDRPSGCRRSRTYGGQRRRDECHPGAFTQVRAVCWGEEERSVNRRLSPRWFEPNTCHQFPHPWGSGQVRAGEAGLRHRLWRGRERFIRLSAVSRAYPWARSGRPRASGEHDRDAFELRKRWKGGCPLDVLRVCRAGLAWALRGAGDRFADRLRTGSRAQPAVRTTAPFHAS